MEKEEKVLDAMAQDIQNADIPESERQKLMKNLLRLKEQKVNLMITGATGCGKSSTINALFDMEVAKVGVGVDPETMDIERYDLDNLILWDSPGLGDGKEADARHAQNIKSKLQEKGPDGNLLIDLVLVILDGSSRDLGTSYDLINSVIAPNLGPEKQNRILVAINQADAAMKGRYWDEENNRPEPKLEAFLEEKAVSVKRRIQEGTGIDVEPIYYSAGYKEEGMPQRPPYNLSKLLYYIVKYTPKEKRLVYVDHMNRDETMFRDDDQRQDYRRGTLEQFGETVTEFATAGADIGGSIGSIFGKTGETIGRSVGGIGGAIVGSIKGLGDIIFGGGSSSGGGGCYITTATCEAYGKPDDCYELTAFRSFRDNWLKAQPDGPALIKRYYRTAPGMVEWINRQPNREDIYRRIRDEYLTPCLCYIEKGENEQCKSLYTSMMEDLYKEMYECP